MTNDLQVEINTYLLTLRPRLNKMTGTRPRHPRLCFGGILSTQLDSVNAVRWSTWSTSRCTRVMALFFVQVCTRLTKYHQNRKQYGDKYRHFDRGSTLFSDGQTSTLVQDGTHLSDLVFYWLSVARWSRWPACWAYACSGSLPLDLYMFNYCIILLFVFWRIKFSLSLGPLDVLILLNGSICFYGVID